MRILAISGSPRATSSNTSLLRAAVALAPPGMEISLYDGLGDLPHFNPDLDGEAISPAVKAWRTSLQAAEGIVFSVPEYAHGVPGSLKNALDWVVGSSEFVGKPVAFFNASSRGTYAQSSLTESLTVMSAKVLSGASITMELMGRPLSPGDIVADPDMAATLRAALGAFALAINAGKLAD